MKKFCIIILVTGFILISITGILAQQTENKLNQVELMKQFIGSWKCELGKDTIIIGDNIAFGTGLVCNSQIIVKGKIINSVKQLYGYDSKIDKFIIAELIETSPFIEICKTWFTSANAGELVVTNPDNAPFRFKFEFKNPDLIVQTAIQNDKVIKEIFLTRIKKSQNISENQTTDK